MKANEIPQEIKETYPYLDAKNVDGIFYFSNGLYYILSKPRLNTQFCFGYSCIGQGDSYEEAQEQRRLASSKPDYFLSYNLDEFDNKNYFGENDWFGRCYDSNRVEICHAKYVNWEESRKTKFSEEENEKFREFVAKARARFEKRLHTYLKKYGTSKLHCWTYWVDE